MKYAVWFVRLILAAWMIPAGLNHFYELFPQPMGSRPASTEVITALLDSGLFGIVKAVELLAGLALLFAFRVPLALIVLLPVSFNVWYYDAPLEGWWTMSAVYGWAVLLSNLFLCLAYFDSYRGLFAVRATPRAPASAAAPPMAEAEARS